MSEESPSSDRITELRIQGMRALADVRLPMGGLTVLIGENGSGKSTLIEALELLRRAGSPGNFVNDQLGPFHGGLESLLRKGDKSLRVRLTIEGGDSPLDYALALSRQGNRTIVSEEHLLAGLNATNGQQAILMRDSASCEALDVRSGQRTSLNVDPGALALTAVLASQGTSAQPAAARVVQALGAGRVHVPFELRPGWLTGSPAPMRLPARLAVATELDRLGNNLASCFHKLYNGSTPAIWERTLARVRLGLGDDVVTVRTPAVGPSQIDLVIDFRGIPEPISALSLSDGQLAYLAFVAIAELNGTHGFLAFDEPESHMHPELLVRVVWLLEEMARSCPVLLSTHSDRLLDALSEPAKSVVLCELDEARATRLSRPDPEALDRWLKRYRGVGDLRAQGFAPHVFHEIARKERTALYSARV